MPLPGFDGAVPVPASVVDVVLLLEVVFFVASRAIRGAAAAARGRDDERGAHERDRETCAGHRGTTDNTRMSRYHLSSASARYPALNTKRKVYAARNAVASPSSTKIQHSTP